MNSIGERIKEALKHRGKSQVWLATKAGVSKSAITQIFNGETKSPKPENLFAIADALRYKARWLATLKGPKTIEDEEKANQDASDIAFEELDFLYMYRGFPDIFKNHIRHLMDEHVVKTYPFLKSSYESAKKSDQDRMSRILEEAQARYFAEIGQKEKGSPHEK